MEQNARNSLDSPSRQGTESDGADEGSGPDRDEFDEFMRAGDNGAADLSAEPPADGAPASSLRSAGGSAAAGADNRAEEHHNPIAIIAGLFQRVTTSLEHARQELATRADAPPAAPNSPSRRGGSPPLEQARYLRPLRLNNNGHKILAATLDESSRRFSCVTEECVYFAVTQDEDTCGELVVENIVVLQYLPAISDTSDSALSSAGQSRHSLSPGGLASPSSLPSPSPSPSRSRSSSRRRAVSRSALPRARKTTCGTFLSSMVHVMIAFDDTSLTVFSTSGDLAGHPERTVQLSSISVEHATRIQFVGGDAPLLAAGCACGHIVLLDASTLYAVSKISGPDVSVPLASLPTPPVSCVHALSLAQRSDAPLTAVQFVAGYSDGTVLAWKESDISFAGHCGEVVGIVGVFGGLLIVSVGSDMDPVVAVTDSHGRCIARRALSFTPTCLYRAGDDSSVVFVGGTAGEVDMLSILVMSPTRVETRLVSRLSSKGNRSNCVSVLRLDAASGILFAVSAAGVVRRWELGRAESEALSQNFTTSVQTDVGVDVAPGEPGAVSRLSASDRVVDAQRVLATLLQDDEVGVRGEEEKDELVNQFSQAQAHMCELATQCDRNFLRAKKVIAMRFAAVESTEKDRDKPAASATSPSNVRMLQISKRTAALELEECIARHREQIQAILDEACIAMRKALSSSLAGAHGREQKLAEVRNAISAI
jgi:hypothetical protein